MSEQRHIIKRQIIELQVNDHAQAQSLQAEAGRVYRQRIVPLIDKFCTALSEPDRIYRIECLEVDLGYVNPENLEADFVARLGTAFPKVLAEHVRRQKQQGSQREPGSKEQSHLELFALFARTGSLPWWADPSRLRLLSDMLQGLIRKAPSPLTRLMRELARESRSLQRIVLNFDNETLSELGSFLSPCCEGLLNQLAQELAKVLEKDTLPVGTTRATQRNNVWLGILRTACLKAEYSRKLKPFLREALLQIAVLSGMTYDALVSGLHRVIQEKTASIDGQLRDMTVTLFEELQGEAAVTEKLIQILARLQCSEGFLSSLCEGLRPVAARLPAAYQARLLAALKQHENGDKEHESLRTISHLLRQAIEHHLLPAVVVRQWFDGLRKRQVSGLSSEGFSELIGMLKKSIEENMTGQSLSDEAPVDLSFSDADDLYIENSGLVILWPFLSHFFEHLDLLDEKRLKDAGAVQRAVGLLQYLVNEDPSPPEYFLPFNKVLCGMELSEVFDFGPPVSEVEAQECVNLLNAVIAHAPILKHMSIPGFRGTFLLRKGVLSTRDGAWLLRVERETYDVVLDRFPWGWEWVKLPWMAAPLRVEW